MRAKSVPAFLLSGLLLFGVCIANGAVLSVGDGRTYLEIQQAIDAAADGDTIQVFGKGPANNYNESLDSNGLNDITIVGMLPNRGIIIDGTGLASRTAGENIRISGVMGWQIENLTFKEDDPGATFNVRLAGGSRHRVIGCRFNSAGVGNNEFHELFITSCSGAEIFGNLWDGTRSELKYQLSIQSDSNSAIVKYNEFAGSNVYISLFVGTEGSEADSCTMYHKQELFSP